MTPFGSAALGSSLPGTFAQPSFAPAAPLRSAAQQQAAQARYRDEAILSASPERLVTMLYDRLMLDLERGEAAQRAGEWQEANAQLQHAQAIVAELTAAEAALLAALCGEMVPRDVEAVFGSSTVEAAEAVHEELTSKVFNPYYEAGLQAVIRRAKVSVTTR